MKDGSYDKRLFKNVKERSAEQLPANFVGFTRVLTLSILTLFPESNYGKGLCTLKHGKTTVAFFPKSYKKQYR